MADPASARLPPLVLASTSRARRAALERLGLQHTSEAPAVDERPHDGESPRALAVRLAAAKAQAVAARHPSACVLAGDQVATIDGVPLGKPGTVARAVAQLSLLAGRTHTLHTAIALVVPASGDRAATLHEACVDVQLTMPAHSVETLRRYVELDEPLECCGSYRIERRGIALFERIETPDFTAIEGLPLLTVTTWLRAAGWPLP